MQWATLFAVMPSGSRSGGSPEEEQAPEHQVFVTELPQEIGSKGISASGGKPYFGLALEGRLSPRTPVVPEAIPVGPLPPMPELQTETSLPKVLLPSAPPSGYQPRRDTSPQREAPI